MTDLTYHTLGLFTMFMHHTEAGKDAWREIAAKSEGTGQVLTMHLQSAIQQLRDAGYSVSKSKPSEPIDWNDPLLNDLLDDLTETEH